MATLIEKSAVRDNPTLLTRFILAAENIASRILVEPANTVNHAERLAWAKRCMFDGDKSPRYAAIMLRAALHLDQSFPDNGENATDAEIQAIVDAYAAYLASSGI